MAIYNRRFIVFIFFFITTISGVIAAASTDVILTTPTNSSSNLIGNLINFTAKLNSTGIFANATLYIWNTTGQVNSTFVLLSGANNTLGIVVNISKTGTYYWNYVAAITTGLQSLNESNFTTFYFTPINLSLNKVNGMKPIEYYSPLTQMQSVRLGNGDIFFADAYSAGRFVNQTKTWQTWGLSGFTNDQNRTPNALINLNNLFIPKLRTGEIHMLQHPTQTNNVLGILNGFPISGGNDFDIHGNAYSFILNTSNNFTSLWSLADGYTQNSANGLAYSYTFLRANTLDIAIGNSSGLVIKGGNEFAAGNFLLGASRYNVTSGLWEDWHNNTNWTSVSTTVINNSEFALPFIDSTLQSVNVKITPIPGKDQYIITYMEGDLTTSWLRAARYNDTTRLWQYYNSTGSWSRIGAKFNLSSMPFTYNGFGVRFQFAVGNSIYLFTDNSTNALFTTYNITSGVWDNASIVSNYTSYTAAPDNNGLVWFVYNNGTDLLGKNYINGQWNIDKQIFHMNQTVTSTPLRMDFTDSNLPVVYLGEQNSSLNICCSVYALADNSTSFWNNEVVLNSSSNLPGQPLLNSTVGVYNRTYANFYITNVLVDGSFIPTSATVHNCGQIAVDNDSYVYCTDSTVGGVNIYPPSYQTLVGQNISNAARWGGSFDGYFSFSGGIAVDNKRNSVYTVDNVISGGQGNMPGSIGTLQVWSKSNRNVSLMKSFVALNGSTVTPSNPYQPIIPVTGLSWAFGVAVDENLGRLYILEGFNNRIDVYDLNGSGYPTFNTRFGSQGSGNKQFLFPQGIDTDSLGNIYVADTGNHRIQKLNTTFDYVGEWGGLSSKSSGLIYPSTVSVDKLTNKTYVSDSYKISTSIFWTNGTLISVFGKFNQTVDYPVTVTDQYYRQTAVGAYNNKMYISTISATIDTFDMFQDNTNPIVYICSGSERSVYSLIILFSVLWVLVPGGLIFFKYKDDYKKLLESVNSKVVLYAFIYISVGIVMIIAVANSVTSFCP